MKRTPAILLGLIAAAWTAVGLAESERSDVVHTGKKRFAIPFQYDAAELARLRTKEVRLYVSVDKGGTWQHVQSVDPDTRRFYVRAPKDGMYWFAVRTVSRDRTEHPSGGRIDPELKVHVDTKPPRFTIQLAQPTPGRIRLTWSARDDHLNPKSLTMQSLQGGAGEWNKVYVSAKASGTTSWNEPGGGTVEVRGRIADRAGNVTTARDSVNITPSGKSVPEQPVPDLNEPIARRGKNLPERFPGVKVERHPPDKPRLTIEPQARPTEPPTQGGMEGEEDEPVAIRKRRAPAQAGEPPADNHRVIEQPVSVRKEQAEPPKPQTQIVRSRRFDIGYRVDRVGSSGVNSVALYITQDGGRKWYRYGTDEDRKSPISVAVPRDGEYGFVIRVRSGAGLGGPPPQSGDRPEVKVVVDGTPPELTLLPILQGTGQDANRFLIRWKSLDANPAKRPISLAYAVKPDGPWITIASDLSNNGRYLWTVADGVPPRVYLKLQSTDRAGNAAETQTDRPIIVDLVQPSAQITDVNPATTDSMQR